MLRRAQYTEDCRSGFSLIRRDKVEIGSEFYQERKQAPGAYDGK
jgi:hypothetical protein